MSTDKKASKSAGATPKAPSAGTVRDLELLDEQAQKLKGGRLRKRDRSRDGGR